MSLLQDPRLRSAQWKDLSRLTTRQRIVENPITIPWLVLSCGLAFYHHYLLALPFSFVYFLTGLRQVHNGFHYTLGVNHTLTEATLIVNSLLMMTAMHAVKYNHLRHHKYCLHEEDVEGNCARMSYPGVPTIRLPELSRRIRDKLPDLKIKDVF
jgi:fatty acid desaturase